MRTALGSVAAAWVAVLALLAAMVPAPAARAAPGPGPWDTLATPLFSHLGPREGLPYPVAMSLAQDRDGFVWIGTPGGLARWDGYQMRVFRQDSRDPASLPDNIVPRLLVDEQGRLWLGTVAGPVSRYGSAPEPFVSHREPD